MANFWDNLNNQAAQRASQGAPQSWDEYSKMLAAQTPQPTKKKGFWADQISTGGSLGGALAGGAAGTAILPGVGTLIGALLGGAVGGAGGQVAENKITGEQDLMKDVGTEALWGGATALPFGAGLKLAKAGGTLAKGLGSTTARQGAMNLVQEAGIKTMGKKALGKATLAGTLGEGAQSAAERLAKAPTLGQKLGSKLSGTADDFAVKQFRLTPTQLANYNKKFGEDAGQTIRKYGFANADDVALKGIDPLQTQFSETVKGIGAIPAATIKQNLDAAAKKLTSSAVSDNKAIGKSLQNEADQLIKRFGKDVDASELNAIRREYDSLVNYTNSVADPARYGVNKRVADALRKTLQSSDTTGTLKQTGRELQKLRQLSDAVAKQGELGRGSLPVSLTGLLGAGVGGGAIGGVPGAIGGAILTQGLNSPMGRKATMGVVDKVASGLSRKAPSDLGQTLKQAATRIGGVGVGASALGVKTNQSPSDLNSTPEMNMTSMTNAPEMNPNMSSPYTQPEQPSSPLGYSSTQIASALMQALSAGDTASAKQLSQMYELASTFEASAAESQAAPKMSQGQQERQDLITALDNTESIMAGGSVDYGPVSSRINDVKAVFNAADPETLAYKNTIQGMRAAITKARAGASLTDGELKMLKQYTPEYTDSEQVVRSKLTALRQLYGYSVPNISGGIDQATLEAALSQR